MNPIHRANPVIVTKLWWPVIGFRFDSLMIDHGKKIRSEVTYDLYAGYTKPSRLTTSPAPYPTIRYRNSTATKPAHGLARHLNPVP